MYVSGTYPPRPPALQRPQDLTAPTEAALSQAELGLRSVRSRFRVDMTRDEVVENTCACIRGFNFGHPSDCYFMPVNCNIAIYLKSFFFFFVLFFISLAINQTFLASLGIFLPLMRAQRISLRTHSRDEFKREVTAGAARAVPSHAG